MMKNDEQQHEQSDGNDNCTPSSSSSSTSLAQLDDLVVLRVLGYLPVRDLLVNCSRVNQKWHALVHEEISRRHEQIETFLMDNNNDDDEKIWSIRSSSSSINRSQLERQWLNNTNFYSLANFSIVVSDEYFVKKCVVNTESNEGEEDECRAAKRTKYSNSSLAWKHLPDLLKITRDHQLEHVLIAGYGFMATSFDRSRTIEVESGESRPVFGGVCFPQNDTLFRFKLIGLTYEEASRIKSSADMRGLFELKRKDDEEKSEFGIRWLLVLAKNMGKTRPFLNAIQNLQTELDFACSGGIPYNFYHQSGKSLILFSSFVIYNKRVNFCFKLNFIYLFIKKRV